MAGTIQVCPQCKVTERIRHEDVEYGLSDDCPFRLGDTGFMCKKCDVNTVHITQLQQ